MKLVKKEGSYRAFHKQTERDLSSLIGCLKEHEASVNTASEPSVKLTAIVDGQSKILGGAYVSPLFADYDRDDLMAMHFYTGLYSTRLLVEDNVLPEIPFLVTIIDQEGTDLVTLKCTECGWMVIKFAASEEHLSSLVKILERVDALAAALTTKPGFVAA